MMRAIAIVGAFVTAGGAALAGPGASGHGHSAEMAYGRPGDPKKPARVIEVKMHETDDGKMLFTPDKILVKKGEQVRFKVVNSGATAHEMVVATKSENHRHKLQMEKHPEMEHDDPNAVRLAQGKAGDILWRFTKAGEFEFACLIPGHYESGMHGKILVK